MLCPFQDTSYLVQDSCQLFIFLQWSFSLVFMRVSWGFLRRPKNVHKYERPQTDLCFVGNWGFMRVLEDFGLLKLDWDEWNALCRRCLRTNGLHSMTYLTLEFFSCMVKLPMLQTKKPEGRCPRVWRHRQMPHQHSFVHRRRKPCLKIPIPYPVFGCNPLRCFFPWMGILSLGESSLDMGLSCSVVKTGI